MDGTDLRWGSVQGVQSTVNKRCDISCNSVETVAEH